MRAYVHLLRNGTSSISSLLATAQEQQQQQVGSKMGTALQSRVLHAIWQCGHIRVDARSALPCYSCNFGHAQAQDAKAPLISCCDRSCNCMPAATQNSTASLTSTCSSSSTTLPCQEHL
jgi:hypothetical protein